MELPLSPASSASMAEAGAAAVMLALLPAIACRVDWRAALGGERAHLFWGCATGVAALWHLSLGPVSGLHLLGAAAACALLGPRLALLALALGIGFQHGADAVGWPSYAPAWLLGGALPVVLSAAVLALAGRGERRLGPLPRVAAAFAAGAGSMLAVVGVRAWLGALPAIAPHDGTVLMAAVAAMALFEANLSVSVLTLVGAHRPDWIESPLRAVRRR